MTETTFDRDAMARHYAAIHREVDPGVRSIYYLPAGAPEREIRFIEVNDEIVERDADPVEPFDCGEDRSYPVAYRLMVIDVTPRQWQRIEAGTQQLPPGWTLDGNQLLERAGQPA